MHALWVEQKIRREASEAALVGDRQLRCGLQVRDAAAASGTDGRQREIGNVVALVDDLDAVGELDQGVEGTGIEQAAGERNLEARVRKVRDLASREGEARAVDDVRDDRLSEDARQVEDRIVEDRRNVELVEVERRLVVVKLDCRLDRQVRLQVLDGGEDQALDELGGAGRSASFGLRVDGRRD